MTTRTNRKAKPAKPTDIVSHWATLMDKLQLSSQEFYARVEQDLQERQVPGITLDRVDWKEGGMLSARREYLRVGRDRLIFDICAAPFGTSFFVSTWFGEKPLRLGALVWFLLICACLAPLDYFVLRFDGLSWQFARAFGYWWMFGWILVLAAVALLALAIRYAMHLDGFLIRTPIIGYFYERYFRTITYFRIDLICMYQRAVQDAVERVIDHFATAQGLPPLSEFQRKPVHADLGFRKGVDGKR